MSALSDQNQTDASETLTPSTDPRERVMALLDGFTTETTPASAAKVADFREHLRPGTVVYITFLPGSNYLDTVAAAKRLREEGMTPVPHFAARSIPDTAMLEDYLARVTGEAGVERVLAIAGAVEKPLGQFTDSMQLLDTGLFDKHGIKTVGVAGHPEGSPDFSDEAALQAVKWKNAFAERSDADFHIVTQFSFEAAPIIDWDRQLTAAGNRMPIHIGVAGLASMKTLLNYAIACGIGNSAAFLKKQAKNVTKLLKAHAPDTVIAGLANYAAEDPACNVVNIHFYPLGGLKKTARWAYLAADGKFDMKKDSTFALHEEV